MFTLLRFKVHGSLYIIHGAFKTGAESSRLNIKAMFKEVFTIL